jgi:hypothetical protein
VILAGAGAGVAAGADVCGTPDRVGDVWVEYVAGLLQVL